MNIFLTFFVVFLVSIIYSIQKDSMFIVSLVKGFMLGCLYNKELFEEGGSEHTVQFCFGFVTFTMIWETE